MKEKVIRFLKTNYLIFVYWFISIVMELTAVAVVGGTFFIRKPWVYLSLVLVLTCAMYSIRNNNGRFWFSFALLLFNFAIDLVFIVVYEMTGAIFDFAMLNLRSDAMAIIESLPINFWYVSVAGILLSAYVVFGRYSIKRMPQPGKAGRLPVAVTASVMAVTILFHAGLAYVSHRNYDPGDMVSKLYRDDTSTYTDKGIMGNFFDQLYKGAFFSKVELGDKSELDEFIYDANGIYGGTEQFGAAKGYNVITILGESMEWFGFTADGKDFPNGFDDTPETQEKLRALYPNLYKLRDESVVMTNFHSREKTDISENFSVMGAYPTDKIINYDYAENTVVTSLARTLKALDPTVTANSFHNGTASFYNRNAYLCDGLGFDSFTSSDEMVEKGMTDYIAEGERNLDSEMIDTCFAEMFPTDRRFYTYITTITQHGQYEPRENLQKYYDRLDANGLLPLPEKSDKEYATVHNLRTYAAAAMELDVAIGRIDAYLTERGLRDNTVLVLFGDHNAYYSSLTNDVKDIPDGKYETDRNYTDLFRVPLMIRVGNGETVRSGALPHIVDKFTCTADIVPTLYDLLGIKTFGNLLYGHSVFDKEESVLYSRAYDVFITDKIYFTSLSCVRYRTPDADAAYMAQLEERAKVLLNKVSHTNRIFAYDYLSKDKADEYYERLKAIQD